MMPDIESLGPTLVYKAGVNLPVPPGLELADGRAVVRTEVRALAGMQKEALVYLGPTGTSWRMVSDEGPYLNGTDLAPFPLAFFTAGMALSFVDELLKHAAEAGIAIEDYKLIQENFYTMEGSAIRGDMVGGALPVDIVVELKTDADAESLREVVARAEKTSPAQACLSCELVNTFNLVHNGELIPIDEIALSSPRTLENPGRKFESLQPSRLDDTQMPNIIEKVRSAETVFGVEGGAGSSLRSEQRRTLHVRGICTPGHDDLKEVEVQLIKPLGSTFRFLGDSSEKERAPSSLAYLSAGIAFCFMTQIGRYAAIVKQDLKKYCVVQDTVYKIRKDAASVEPVDTHVFLETGDLDDAARKTLFMSERTCFLHAAMRGSTSTNISMQLHQ